MHLIKYPERCVMGPMVWETVNSQELGMVFQRWYPDLQLEEEPLAV